MNHTHGALWRPAETVAGRVSDEVEIQRRRHRHEEKVEQRSTKTRPAFGAAIDEKVVQHRS
jgi:hypothetical protein